MVKTPVVIAGPTAVGKTALALALARELNGEIINIDSVQLYRGLEIGAAKPRPEERRSTPHHLFDLLEPSDQGTVAKYLAAARPLLTDVLGRGHLPIFTGGTGLYITSLLHGLAELPPGNPQLRRDLEKRDAAELHGELQRADPASAARLHPNDKVRIVRALENYLIRGGPASAVQERHGYAERYLNALIIVPLLDRDELYRRIDRRVDEMLDAGLIEEVMTLLSQYGPNAPAFDGIGYREVVEYLTAKGKDIAVLRERIARNTRRFAKRQLTYWKNEPSKRGWKVRPASDEESVRVGGESELTRTTIKPISAYELTKEALVQRVIDRLRDPFDKIEVWFVRIRETF